MTKKSAAILGAALSVMVLATTIAISYAYWTVTKSQTSVNTLATGCFDLELTEGDTEIKLENTYPMSEEKAGTLIPYTFTITNTCSIYASYKVNLETLVGSTLSTNFLAFKLNNDDRKILGSLETATTVEDGSLESRVIATGGLDTGKSRTYTLRVWVDESVTLQNDAQNKEFKGKIIIEAVASAKQPVCKRANLTALHKDTCLYGYASGCRASGYAENEEIVYGNQTITDKELNAGDAFTCDVNGDGIYDEEKERFYYVSDYYDTINSTDDNLVFDENTAVLLYYNNIIKENGKLVVTKTTGIRFDEYRDNYVGTLGPHNIAKSLPTASDWPNVSLKNNVRQLRTEKNKTTISYGSNPSLPQFDYTGYTARMLTAQESKQACDWEYGYGNNKVYDHKCSFLFENTRYSDGTLNPYGYWLETYAYDNPNRAFYANTSDATFTNTYVDYAYPALRPVIEVPKTDMQY